MKKFSVLAILSLIFVFSLTACDLFPKDDSANVEETPVVEEPVATDSTSIPVAFIIKDGTDLSVSADLGLVIDDGSDSNVDLGLVITE